MKGEIRFFTFLSIVIGMLIVLAFVSYVGNTGNNTYESKMVKNIQSGNNVSFDQGDLNKFHNYMIDTDPINRDIIVLGSSRAWKINDNIINKFIKSPHSFFNHCVSTATIGDNLILIHHYLMKGYLPKTIIIEIDPWSFNKNFSMPWHSSYNNEYMASLKKIGYSQQLLDNIICQIDWYKQLLSRQKIISSLKYFLDPKTPLLMSHNTKEWIAQDGTINAKDEIFFLRGIPNGSFDIEKDANEVNIKNRIYERSKELDSERVKIFDKFIQYLLIQNVTPVFYLSPYHDIVYQKFISEPEFALVPKTELYIRNYAKKNNITVIGSYDPTPFNLSSSDFYDWVHPRPEAIARIFENGPVIQPIIADNNTAQG